MALKCNAVAHVMLLTSAASTRHVSASVVCVCQSLRGAPNSTRVTFHFLNKKHIRPEGDPKKNCIAVPAGQTRGIHPNMQMQTPEVRNNRRQSFENVAFQ